MKKKGKLLEERDIFLYAKIQFIDITEKMQRLADKGRYQLFLDKDTFDPNHVFGNPNPGQPKVSLFLYFHKLNSIYVYEYF
jgi:hypothetical protein